MSYTMNEHKFVKAKDSRGREVDGMWVRNGRYYYVLYIPSKKDTRFVPLFDQDGQPIRNLRDAQDAAVVLRKERSEGEEPQSRRAPLFKEYYLTYISWLETTHAKDPLTIQKEKGHLKGWARARFLGEMRVNQIRTSDVNDYVLHRKKSEKDGGEEVSNRTANLDVIALSNCLKRAVKEGFMKVNPCENYEALTHVAPKRPLFTREEIDALCTEALRKKENGVPVHVTGDQLADWLRLMQWSGARHTAALSAKWDQVDFDNKQITLYTKYDKTVVVDFNENLEAHLLAMKERKLEGCDYLFPSIRVNTKGEQSHCTRMYKSLLRVQTEVAKKFPRVADFTPHDLRHFFISWCVASGIDFLIIKEWVGHADTKLIANTYGHVGNEHRENAVKKLSTPKVVELPKPTSALDELRKNPEELLKLLQEAMAAMKSQAA